MNSSMLAGERRWASARRGGMTVLGKVTVPKPINLPSQKLENHGLDPSVEIVPKGTLSWGSRPSSSGSNAWVSSASNADGGAASPSHLTGRPSSGGRGTRPSTAGSVGTFEPVSNARSSNSRPSSASGTLTSNQTSSASLRPRSAETRPSSSQLSRFAESESESSVAWRTSSTAERLGVGSSNDDRFTLSSVDFPTLGSKEENPEKEIESQVHLRPRSSSGRIVLAKDRTEFSNEAQLGTADTIRTDSSQRSNDGFYPSMEKWRGESHQFFNAKAPRHSDAWRGPVNAPPGPMCRGYPVGPAFRAPVAPGCFPREPFPFYQQPIPPPALRGSMGVPTSAAGPGGSLPRNGGLFRPQVPGPDAYAHPGMPFNPGFNHGVPGPAGPPMSFEGYYGPPMGYCMPAAHPFFDGYPPPGAHDLANSRGRSSGPVSTGNKPMEVDHKGHQWASSKIYNNDKQREERENWEHNIQFNPMHPGRSGHPITFHKDEWGAEERTNDNDFSVRKIAKDDLSHNFEYQRNSSDYNRIKSFEGVDKVKEDNDNRTKILPSMSSFSPEMPQAPLACERKFYFSAATEDSHQMQKRDGLGVRDRALDGLHDSMIAYNRAEWISDAETETKYKTFSVEVCNNDASFGRTSISGDYSPAPPQAVCSVTNMSVHPAPFVSRSDKSGSCHGRQGRVDHYGKGKLNNTHDTVGLAMKHITPESSDAMTSLKGHEDDPNFIEKTAQSYIIDSMGKPEGKSSVEMCDTSDVPAQRAKMRELAKQRALQLQKEEEERIREQKAKAFAKLEELNRRTQAGEVVSQKYEATRPSADAQGTEDFSRVRESDIVDPMFTIDKESVSNLNATSLEMDSSNYLSEISAEVPKYFPPVTPQPVPHASCVEEDDHDANAGKLAILNDLDISKCNREGYKQKQNKALQKTVNERVGRVECEAPADHVDAGSNVHLVAAASSELSSGSNMPNASNTVAKPSIQHRRKSISSKNQHKLDEIQNSVSNITKDPDEHSQSSASLLTLDHRISTVTDPDREVQAALISSLPAEGDNSRGTNQYKHQISRRTSKNHVSSKFLPGNDTVVWAPVRTPNKDEGATVVGQKLEPVINAKSDDMVSNVSKGKRAEMERYVPKPVAKELAQQESIPTTSLVFNSSTLDEAPGNGQSGSSGSASQTATASVGSSVELREGDGRYRRNKKEHGTWRQRVPSHTKNEHFRDQPTFEQAIDVGKSTETKSVKKSTSDESKSGVIDVSDCYNTSRNVFTSMGKGTVAIDQSATVSVKQNQSKVPRSVRKYDYGHIQKGETDGSSTVSAAPDVTKDIVASKDNYSLGDRPSHWQPKSNPKSANYQPGNVSDESGIETVEVTKASRKLHPSHNKSQIPPQREKKNFNTYQPQIDQSSIEIDGVGESMGGRYQEPKREKKSSIPKEPQHFPNQDAVTSVKPVPSENNDISPGHNHPSSSRTSGRQNARPLRSYDSRGDWSSGQSNGPLRERQRQNAHYEYRPHKNNKSDKLGKQAYGGE